LGGGFSYYLPGVPAGASLSAFMPRADKYAASGAQQYKHAVTGQPGTQAIPAPTGDTVPSPDLGDLALAGTSRSSDSPDVWYPQKWYERSLDGDGTMGPVTPVRIYSDNLMPVPAVDPRGRGALLAKPIVQRGGRQLRQPSAMPRWLPWGGNS
jgi:hypothetical protein